MSSTINWSAFSSNSVRKTIRKCEKCYNIQLSNLTSIILTVIGVNITYAPLHHNAINNKQNRRRRHTLTSNSKISSATKFTRNGRITPNRYRATSIVFVCWCFLCHRQIDGIFIGSVENQNRICMVIEPSGQLESIRDGIASDHRRYGFNCFIHFTTQSYAYRHC